MTLPSCGDGKILKNVNKSELQFLDGAHYEIKPTVFLIYHQLGVTDNHNTG